MRLPLQYRQFLRMGWKWLRPRSVYAAGGDVPIDKSPGASAMLKALPSPWRLRILGEKNMQRNQSKYARPATANRIAPPLFVFVAATLALLLTGCSPSALQNASSAAAPTRATVSQAAVAPESIPSTTNSRDKTADFKTAKKDAPWLDMIKTVTETEPGRISVQTSLLDRRGAEGSEESRTAIAICESVVTLFGPSYVSVLENDGTNFVLFGHPSVPTGACTEV